MKSALADCWLLSRFFALLKLHISTRQVWRVVQRARMFPTEHNKDFESVITTISNVYQSFPENEVGCLPIFNTPGFR
jgi:hypothetical protein